MKDAATLQRELDQFTGTESYTRWSILFRNHVLTDGAKFLADNGGEHGAYWLMDAIASYHAKCMKDPMLRDMQFWTLKVNREPPAKPMTVGAVLQHKQGGQKAMAVLTCERDTGNVAFRQEIPYTDFQLDEIKLYVAPMGDGQHFVILLPSEY